MLLSEPSGCFLRSGLYIFLPFRLCRFLLTFFFFCVCVNKSHPSCLLDLADDDVENVASEFDLNVAECDPFDVKRTRSVKSASLIQ